MPVRMVALEEFPREIRFLAIPDKSNGITEKRKFMRTQTHLLMQESAAWSRNNSMM